MQSRALVLAVVVVVSGAALLPSAARAQGDTAAEAPATWAFQPLRGEAALSSAAIDRRIDEQLAARGLSRSAAADRRTLLRRAAYALTGLPPGPDEIAAFAADSAPDALPRAIDRLFASPHYGEHQARAWLDLARYSDSNGLDENLAFAQAWRYRDWVVRACNDDLPFDRFGTMQIAGDLLPAPTGHATEAAREDALVATGFLALGPKLLAEQDKDKLVLDTVDEQLDLVGRTFLGLTIGCARCHDHKFDPIPTRDYYALAGIFKSTTVFENLDHVSRWVEAPLASADAIADRDSRVKTEQAAQKRLADVQVQRRREQQQRLLSRLGRALQAGRALGARAIARAAADADATNLHRDDHHWGSADCVVLHTHTGGVQFAEYAVEIRDAGRFRLDVRLASIEARPLRVLVDGKEQLASVLAVTTADWFPADQRWFPAGELQLEAGAHVLRLEAVTANVPHLHRWLLTPLPAAADAPCDLPAAFVRNAQLAVADPGTELGRDFRALGADAPAGEVAELAARWQGRFESAHAAWQDLLQAPRDAAGQAQKPAPTGLPEPSLERTRLLLLGQGGLLHLGDDALLRGLPAADAQELAALTAQRDTAQAAVPPAPPTAMCARDAAPVELAVLARGNHLAPAKTPTPRGFLSALEGALPPPAVPKDHSGRLELARWLFDARNPLTARVAANRVWLGLFGQGLVRSPSNFGARGGRPSHPELLDELALSLQQDGWSIKRLQRRILLSQTWQQQSRGDPTHWAAGDAVDPDDRWLWRQQRRRLPAEAIRDSILVAAGTLDRTLGGSLLDSKDRDYVTNDQSADRARYDAPRRSLYLPIIRNAMFELFTAFDYADPSVHLEQRPQSAVAPQALLLMNSPFVFAQSQAFARQALAAAADADARIGWIWQQALQRAPDAGELAAAQRYLAQARATAAAGDTATPWPGLCQTLLCTNEFVYVD